MKAIFPALVLALLIGLSGPSLAEEDNYQGNYPQFPDWADRIFTEADNAGD